MEQKSAFIAIVGRPNVGKSSLMNKILGQKVAIVSNKPQTTRTRIMGIDTVGNIQYVFIDTPGLHKPHDLLGNNMIKAVSSSMTDINAAVLVADASADFDITADNIPFAERELIDKLKQRKIEALLVLNKIDLLENKERLLKLIDAYIKNFDFDAVIPLSAKTGDGISNLMQELEKYAVISPHYFSDDDITDQSERVMAAEMIREKILRLLSKEVPHGIAVDIERFSQRTDSSGLPIIDIDAVIYCEKESHKGIIIGKKGDMLKRIGALARKDMESFFDIRVALKLWVKVKEDWRNRQGLIHTFGLDFKED